MVCRRLPCGNPSASVHDALAAVRAKVPSVLVSDIAMPGRARIVAEVV